METLVYLHLALTYEGSPDHSEQVVVPNAGFFVGVKSRSRPHSGLLILGTALGLLGTTANAFALIQQGDRHPQVTRVQKRLQELKLFREEPTGYFGEVTIDAVKQFQQDHGLIADGIVGAETEAALFNQTPRSNSPFNSTSFLSSPEAQPNRKWSPEKTSKAQEEQRLLETPEQKSSPNQTTSNPPLEETPPSEGFLSETLKPEPIAAEKSPLPIPKEANIAHVPPTELLKVGARSELVTQLQKKLQDAGFEPGEIDGIYGQETKKAVIALQRSHGLFVDGIAGPQTLSTLNLGSPESSQRLYTVKVRNS